MHVIMTLDATSIGGATQSDHVFAAGQAMEYQDDEDGESSMRWKIVCFNENAAVNTEPSSFTRHSATAINTRWFSSFFSHLSVFSLHIACTRVEKCEIRSANMNTRKRERVSYTEQSSDDDEETGEPLCLAGFRGLGADTLALDNASCHPYKSPST